MAFNFVLHLGQCDGGKMTDLSSGMREMHTLRKLPVTRPKIIIAK